MIDLHAVVESRLRTDGQRYTRNHQAVVAILEAADRPLSLPELLRRGRGLPQSSAYRSLAVLEAAGVVHKVVTAGDFARFELAQELTQHHHHHRICSSCGDIEDFTLPAEVEAALDRALGRIAKGARFAPSSHQLDLLGRCASCR